MSTYAVAASPDELPGEVRPITLSTLGRFLLGRRDAILSLAACRQTLWLGLMLVFSAALAREYDGEDLLHEPWHLLLPLVASLVTSFILFGLISLVAWCRHAGFSGFWSRYRKFLGLYWMTAPLAWMYAIPVERFLSAGDATTTNLNLLAIVSLWRVLLMTRIVSVLLSAPYWQAFCLVMLFADTVALALVSQIDVQVFAIMGGVRLTEAEAALAGAKILVSLFGTLSWPIWLIASLALTSRRWAPWVWSRVSTASSPVFPKTVWSVATVAVLLGLAPLPWTQSEQQRRGAAERAFRAGRYDNMLATMSAYGRDEFPPHWDPPPRIGASRERQRIVDVVKAFSPDTAPWVRALYCNKLSDGLGRHRFPMETLWTETNAKELLELLNGLPEAPEILKGKSRLLENLSGFGGAEFSKDSPQLQVLLMKAAEPPDQSEEYSAGSIPEWLWEQYLKSLESVKDRQLVLKYHATHLNRILSNSKFVPQNIQDRIRILLSKLDPVAEPRS